MKSTCLNLLEFAWNFVQYSPYNPGVMLKFPNYLNRKAFSNEDTKKLLDKIESIYYIKMYLLHKNFTLPHHTKPKLSLCQPNDQNDELYVHTPMQLSLLHQGRGSLMYIQYTQNRFLAEQKPCIRYTFRCFYFQYPHTLAVPG